jgi:hypothetical protein
MSFYANVGRGSGMHRNFLKWYIISLRVEVSLFVLSPEIEDRNAVEVDKKRTSTLNDIYVLTGLQINLYLKQPMEIQLFATFFQRRK